MNSPFDHLKEELDDIRKRFDELENQSSNDELPVPRPPATPHYYPYYAPPPAAPFMEPKGNIKIFDGKFTQWDFFVLGCYTLIVMLFVKMLIVPPLHYR